MSQAEWDRYTQTNSYRRAVDPDRFQFCPHCDVAVALHDGPDTCDLAQRKAALITRFFGVVGRS